jgi:Rrf2 family protein
MRVSQKLDYALHAMLELAIRADQPEHVRTADIARQQRIPEKFLEAIVVELRRAGLIVSQRGPVGGHRLARSADAISMGDIWRAIEGPALEQPALRSNNNKGPDPFAEVWDRVDRVTAGVVDGVSLAELRRRSEARQNVPDFSI